jgi:hypothetical protein
MEYRAMITRRTFLGSAGAAGCLSLGHFTAAAAGAAPTGLEGRQYLELQKYTIANEAQRDALHAFLKDVAVPALNRRGIKPVGVFQDPNAMSPVFVLIPHPTAESALRLNHELLADAEFTSKGASFIEAAKEERRYEELESWLMLTFKGMPKVETPVTVPGRIFQLRIYESPSLRTGQKKIEMFNDAGEIRIFREVGLAPVFFGETLYGAKMPNLTYMLAFSGADSQKEAWGRFGKHPDWQKLRTLSEYADGRILRGIVNIGLTPAEYSQI